MNGRSYGAWLRAGMDAVALGIDSSMVVGMRLTKFATGADPDGKEARLMVAEKVRAVVELQSALMAGKFGATPLSRTQKTIAHYGRKVAANRKRLGK